MRILITSDIFPPDVGGPATYVPNLAGELSRRGHRVTVVTYSAQADHPEDERYGFRVVRVALNPRQPKRMLRTLTAILSHGREAGVIYANGLITESALANMWLRKPILAKAVGDLAWERARDKGWVTDEFEAFQTRRYAPRVEFMRWRRTWSYRRMGTVIVPSAYLKRILAGHWGLVDSHVEVIYNSFKPSGQAQPAKQLTLPAMHKVVTVCRLTGWKGVDGLIDALTGLPDCGLVVIGDGPLRAELEAQARRVGVAASVLFAGTVPREEVSAYLRACDVFVLNSTYEGFPHVLLEALAAGLPVVATDVGGSGEIVQDGLNGCLVPPRDPQALRRAIRGILDNSEARSRLAKNGLATLSRFTPQVMFDRTEAAIAGVTETRRA